MKETWITVSAFARATGLSYWLATQMVNAGEIPSVVIGKRRRGRERDTENEQQRAAPSHRQR